MLTFLAYIITKLLYIAHLAGTVDYTDWISSERLPPQWVSWYDTKQSDGEAPVMEKLWKMWSASSIPSLPGPLWHGVVASDMGQIEIDCVLMLNWIVWNRSAFNIVLIRNWIVWNRYFICIKNRFGINNVQWLICCNTKPNQTKQAIVDWWWWWRGRCPCTKHWEDSSFNLHSILLVGNIME